MPFENDNGLAVDEAHVFLFWSGGQTPKPADALVTRDDFLQLAHTALSNFFASPIRCYLNGKLVVFPSAEHLFQALMAPDHVADFLVGGPIGELNEATFAFVGVKAEERAKKDTERLAKFRKDTEEKSKEALENHPAESDLRDVPA